MSLVTRTLCIFLLLVLAICVITCMRKPVSSGERQLPPCKLARELISSFSVRRHGLYGVDLVKCRSVRVQKLRCGFMVLGGVNELVLDDLTVVLPPVVGQVAEKSTEKALPLSSATPSAELKPQQVLDFLGIEELKSSMGQMPRFSSLAINGFALSRLDSSTNVVARLTAVSAKGVRRGLKLKEVVLFRDGGNERVPSAVLEVSPVVKLVWSGGEMVM